MINLANGYKKLFEDANTPNGYRVYKETVPFENLSHFVGVKGTKYDRQNIRLLIVGRAVNGWGSLNASSSDAFSKNACDRFENEHFSWIVCDNGVLRNNVENEADYYWLDRSSFWRTSKKIRETLSNDINFENTTDDKWTDYIAWTNLYKVAPLITGNPTTQMCKKQLEACKEILKAEIEIFKPTHILFITDYQWWFKDFEDIFDTTFTVNGINKYRGEKNNIFAEAYATTNDGTKIVVACRPEMRDENAYVKDVINFLK